MIEPGTILISRSFAVIKLFISYHLTFNVYTTIPDVCFVPYDFPAPHMWKQIR
jgi:hypothetical protein